MSAAELVSLSAIVALILVWVLGIAATIYQLPRFCRHRSGTVRYWFRNHVYERLCKRCHIVLERGRDVTHRYPDAAPGVRRGHRSSEEDRVKMKTGIRAGNISRNHNQTRIR